jgi:CheY-like chemotaxis protein
MASSPSALPTTGEEALALLAAEPDIELMLLDINMPVMDERQRFLNPISTLFIKRISSLCGA